ncbi:RpiB/LacA/LacB family sugar-phosphate isomerase [Candidatus Gottesmanbacteria bacterium]|nr:RpiB/LacA/LacB family sugar-phosphate isomerase [Candidatus Gottesmanbacteria bacterium]
MIYIGSDHGGFDLKEKIKGWLKTWGYSVEDVGNAMYDKEDDYPQFAFLVGQKVSLDEKKGIRFPYHWKDRSKGILCCRSAAGMVVAANKVSGARAALAFDVRSARHCREHNDVNILALSGDWLEEHEAKKILKTWLDTEFSGEERHVRRLKQIEEYG